MSLKCTGCNGAGKIAAGVGTNDQPLRKLLPCLSCGGSGIYQGLEK